MSGCLNQLLEILHNTPEIVSNSLMEIKKLDEETKTLMNEYNQEGAEILVVIKEGDSSTNITEIDSRIKAHKEKKEVIDQMIQKKQKIANELYNSVDSAINKYDEENEKLKLLLPHSTSKQSKGDEGSKDNKKRKADDIESKLGFLVDTDTIEESADPMEPKYCFCQRVSFGQMIGCDNEDCPIEWFHFECVGLHPSTPQPEEWYCSEKCKLEWKATQNNN